MAANNINYSIILSSYKVDMHRPSTAQILELTKKHEGLLVVAGFSIDNHTEDVSSFTVRMSITIDMMKDIKECMICA